MWLRFSTLDMQALPRVCVLRDLHPAQQGFNMFVRETSPVLPISTQPRVFVTTCVCVCVCVCEIGWCKLNQGCAERWFSPYNHFSKSLVTMEKKWETCKSSQGEGRHYCSYTPHNTLLAATFRCERDGKSKT